MDPRSHQPVITDSVEYWYETFWNEHGDPRVMEYPFFRGGPWYLLALVASYLYFVRIFGPTWMKNRRPFDLRRTIFVYNLVLVCINAYFVYQGTLLTNCGLTLWKCVNVDPHSNDPIALWTITLGYAFFISKLLEFSDTLFFILRKKFSQASPLHVIHHSLVPVLVWIGFKLSPGGNNLFFPFINSIVHTIMYLYYALSTFPSLAPYLWWKKYLTTLQMVQFVLIIVHSLRGLVMSDCHFPKVFMYLSIANALLFLGLFYSFYEQRYKTKVQFKPSVALEKKKISSVTEENDLLQANGSKKDN